ncbi:MAG: hypothetical protein HN566_06535 [Polaribacter sp.]|nr:hypothetical protein [Polaribacter sp.]
MKKILGIIVLGLLLSGCNHEENFPTSLFGVKPSDKITNYMTEDEWTNVKAKNKDLTFFSTTKGDFKRNNLFNKNYMYVDTITEKVKIVIGEYKIGINKSEIETHPSRCRERRKELLSSLKTLKNIKERDFDKQYYIEERLDDNNKRYDIYKENYFISYNVDDLDYSLNIMCVFDYNSLGGHTQLLHYSLTAVDSERLVTDKDIIKSLNDQIDEKRTVFKKPLSDEVIKNDFRGL